MVNINNLKTTMYTIMFKLNKKEFFIIYFFKTLCYLQLGLYPRCYTIQSWNETDKTRVRIFPASGPMKRLIVHSLLQP